MSNNELKRIDSFEFLTELQILNLSGNNLIDVNFIKNMPNLRELYLKGNRLKSFDSFSNLSKLEVLHLRQNNVNLYLISDSWMC